MSDHKTKRKKTVAKGAGGRKIIISGGGTGGHIFPAIAIANALRQLDPATEVLFVGAKGRMEMERVPAAGYKIIGLNIQGLQRKSLLKNLAFPFKLVGSIMKSLSIIRRFKPHAVVGVGGYASGPLLYAAGMKHLPYLIQEQNSYAGITNKKLGKKAKKIAVAFDEMERFFPAGKIIKTGNPVRKESVDIAGKKQQAMEYFKFSADKKTILLIGGSLGAKTLNNTLMGGMDRITAADVQVIWQTGRYYHKDIMSVFGRNFNPNIFITEFLNKIDLAYAAADIIISRAGAGTIAELAIVGKPVILVPSPNVSEDHQTKNALALGEQDACEFIPDKKASRKLIDAAFTLLDDEQRQKVLSANILKFALPHADEDIAKAIFAMIEEEVD